MCLLHLTFPPFRSSIRLVLLFCCYRQGIQLNGLLNWCYYRVSRGCYPGRAGVSGSLDATERFVTSDRFLFFGAENRKFTEYVLDQDIYLRTPLQQQRRAADVVRCVYRCLL